MSGNARAYTWQPWRGDAEDSEKIGILHEQVELLLGQLNAVHTKIDRVADDLRKGTIEAEKRAAAQIYQLSEEWGTERSHASRVDARGFLPIALGIILAGLPDELARYVPLGMASIAVAVVCAALATNGWLPDFREALKRDLG